MLRAESKDAETIHVMNIQVDRVTGDLIFTQPGSNFFNLRLRTVAIARLVITQRPKRRQRHPASQPGILLNDILQTRTGKKVIVQAPFPGGHRQNFRLCLADIKDSSAGAIQEHTISTRFRMRDIKRNRHVQAISRLQIRIDIGVPHFQPLAPLIQVASFFAKGVKMLVSFDYIAADCAQSQPANAATGDAVAVKVINPKRILSDYHAELIRCQLNPVTQVSHSNL